MTQYLQIYNLPKEVNPNNLHKRISEHAPINDMILVREPTVALVYAASEEAAAALRAYFTNYLFAGKPLTVEDATPEQVAMLDSAHRQVAREAGAVLGEVLPKPMKQLALIAELCGVEFMQAVMQETMDIQARGGMTTKDGSRERTVGGIFFYLAASKLTPEVRKRIFGSSGTGPKEPQEAKAPKPPPIPVLVYAERMEVLAPILEEPGEATTLKVTLIGQPGRVQERRDVVITTMQFRLKQVQLPKGVPEPPKEPTTVAVYISAKQWRKVAEARQQDPQDPLIVEGHCTYDPELKGLAVFAMNVTTKGLQKARRDSEKAAKPAEGADEDAAKPTSPPAHTAPSQASARPPTQTTARPPAAQPPVSSAKLPQADVNRRLAQLHDEEDAARRELDEIKALPPDQQVGFAQALNRLQRIKAEIRQLQQG